MWGVRPIVSSDAAGSYRRVGRVLENDLLSSFFTYPYAVRTASMPEGVGHTVTSDGRTVG